MAERRRVCMTCAAIAICARAQLPFTVKVIEKEMHSAHFSLNANRSAKQQALTVIALLKRTIPIERAQMRVQVTLPAECADDARTRLLALHAVLEGEERGKSYRVVRVFSW
jgi:ribosome maturation protein SDO1